MIDWIGQLLEKIELVFEVWADTIFGNENKI